MLYRTVYGPELEAIHAFVVNAGGDGLTRRQVYDVFLPDSKRGPASASQNLDDALLFLTSAHMVIETKGIYRPALSNPHLVSFQLGLLHNLRQLQRNALAPRHPADATYSALLEELFAWPRRRFVESLHMPANKLTAVKAIGGLNREKLQAWARVMTFLGLGFRLRGGFVFAPDGELMLQLIRVYGRTEGTLQELVEQHLVHYLPCCDIAGDLTISIESELLALQQVGRLHLLPLQDSSSRPYFGTARYRAFKLQNILENEGHDAR